MRIGLAALVLLAAACTGGKDGTRSPSVYEEQGPFPVGNARFALSDTAGRVLLTEAWYPADESERAAAELGFPVEEFVPAGPDRDAFVAMLASAPDPGTRRQTRSKLDAIPAAAPAQFPVVVLSHCHECTRFGYFTIAERLASFGFAVLAPDHATNTLFDGTAGLTDDFLQVRGADVSLVLDSALAVSPAALPSALRGRFDASRVGVAGHSFGAATTGLVLQEDPRVGAGLAMGAPVASFLFPSVTIAGVGADPLALLLLEDDDSIGSTGNSLIEGNFADKTPPVWLLRLRDAGHWSISDLCGITSDLGDGCIGDDDWVDVEDGRNAAATWAAAFFELHLNANPDAQADLESGLGLGSVEVRE